MDRTFAGRNACNPDDHERPFIIEWDATDRSSFEAVAAHDVVFVRYEGCKLRVLDACLDVFEKDWSAVAGLGDELIDQGMRKHILALVPKCFEQAKDCGAAWKAYGELIGLLEGLPGHYFSGPKWKGMTPEQQLRQKQGDFAVIAGTCSSAAR